MQARRSFVADDVFVWSVHQAATQLVVLFLWCSALCFAVGGMLGCCPVV